ncbi:YegP family protein [Salinivibrio sp. YCSC6]|uniref:YegP family protein n=1 Tax=Salinivibrio sp. YCSC6 TaxID=2003370 RepID=UPI000BBB9E42|nr:YegP family protein [Salinivibrio sp. YCSC6]PCE67520.1 hypothetical protein B6G00_04000 [Salinivibrio sp. YCSC6]QCF35576.1 DUF1508 domain-containing protein [Salinivibrio sp. YCSC6]
MSGVFEIYKDKANEYRFRLKAGNGEIILKSEGYSSKQGCENGIDSVKTNAPIDSRYERKDTPNPMFNLKAANHEIIGTSETYSSTQARDKGIESVKANAPGATIKELTH